MSIKLKSLIKAIAESSKNYNYHRYHVIQSTRILKGIERQRGKISNHDKKLCDDYALDVFGHKHFAPWLCVYTAIAGKFKEGWIPDNYYGSLVVPKINGSYGMISSLKPLNSVIFQNEPLPDLLSYVNGVYFDSTCRFVSTEEAEKILFANQERVVFKLDNSFQGQGIHFFSRDGFFKDQIPRLGNGLFQSFINQHELFEKFTKDSVATIRFTTVYTDNGEVSVRACYLRLGSSNETHVQSKSHIRVPIDMETGAFSEVGYTTQWHEITVHPTSKLKFSGNTIPSFRECIDTVTEFHKKVPFVRCIGWDVAVDREQKVKLMEWNAKHNDIKFSEATQGPCFVGLGWESLMNAPLESV